MASNLRYYIINKPYKVLSQYTDEAENKGLGSIVRIPKGIYSVGRLDFDSEGLLILTNDKKLNQALLNPENEHKRTYHAEVEGIPSSYTLKALGNGLCININGKSFITKKAEVSALIDYRLPERMPPVNRVKHPQTSWIELILTEGKNRQVRKMTAKVGHPTLRLLRVAIENLTIHQLRPGQFKTIPKNVLYKKLKLHALK